MQALEASVGIDNPDITVRALMPSIADKRAPIATKASALVLQGVEKMGVGSRPGTGLGDKLPVGLTLGSLHGGLAMKAGTGRAACAQVLQR